MRWLTERDKEVLKFIYYHRFVSTSQIASIHFKYKDNGELQKYPLSITRRRLKRYREEDLIKSFYTSNTDMIHSIDERGVMIVASILGTVFNKLYYSPRDDLISIGVANHSLALNDLYISLLDEAEALGGNIMEYTVESLNRKSFNYRNKNYILQPDAYLLYKPNKKKNIAYPFFIEMDLDTQAPKAYATKVERYESYYDSNEFQKQYKTFPKIVTLTTTKVRRDRLRDYAKTKLNWDYMTIDNSKKILRAY